MEDLPADYDAIVIGTGMTGSIAAAALSRIGKAVLHLDQNEHYGEEWASFNLEAMQAWVENSTTHSFNKHENITAANHLKDGEKFVKSLYTPRCSNVSQKWLCRNEELHENEENTGSGTEDAEMKSDIEPSNAEDVNNASKSAAWTKERLLNEHRKFNLDLCPKMLYARGSLVKLLTSSNIARYADFKLVSRVLTWREDNLESVPCSRADVFATKNITVVHKRMLVKVLSVLMEYPASASEFEGFEKKTFLEYLRHKKLSEQVIHYILYAIAMGSESTPCIDGVLACQRFMESLGRFGNTPFIIPMYGAGELPQCFCRLCAVFGGVYHLKRPVEGFILNSSNEAVAIASAGQRLNAKHFIVSSAACPPTFIEESNKIPISRAVYITDRSVLESEKEAVTLLQFPPNDNVDVPVTVMELGGSCQVCPAGLFVVHMTCQSSKGVDIFEDVCSALFRKNEELSAPSILWSLTYNIKADNSGTTAECPPNIKVFSGPDASLDYEESVDQAKRIFQQLCPNEEFLPRAPEPDEIVMDEPVADTSKEDTSPGSDGDSGQSAIADVSNLNLSENPPVDNSSVDDQNIA